MVLANMGGAHADPTSPNKPVPPASAPEAQQDPAVARYLEGERHYAAGRYELAVVEFEAALKLSNRLELHFNIANCYERSGSYALAAKSLEQFLAGGAAPEPEILRERIWRLKRRADEQQARFASQVEVRVRERLADEAASRPIPIEAPRSSESALPQRQSRRPAYYTLAAGGALLTTGLVFAGLSRAAGNDAEAECIQRLCSQDAKDFIDKEDRYALLADVTVFAGLAAVGVGGYLWFRSTRKREQGSVQVSPVAGPKTIGVWASAHF